MHLIKIYFSTFYYILYFIINQVIFICESHKIPKNFFKTFGLENLRVRPIIFGFSTYNYNHIIDNRAKFADETRCKLCGMREVDRERDR